MLVLGTVADFLKTIFYFISIFSPLVSDPALTQAWVVIDYNLPDLDLGMPYCPPLDIEISTADEI